MNSCKHYKEVRDGNLSYCSHVGNKDDHEGNCQPENCPLGSDYYSVVLSNTKLQNSLIRVREAFAKLKREVKDIL